MEYSNCRFIPRQLFPFRNLQKPLNTSIYYDNNTIFPHYLSESHPDEGLALGAEIAVPPIIKNRISYYVIAFLSISSIFMHNNKENINLSFSSKDLTTYL